MAYRLLRGVEFVSHLPGPRGARIPVLVGPLEASWASWWHAEIQPELDRIAPKRADHGWSWPRFVSLHAAGVGLLRQEPRSFVIGVERPGRDEFVPCALSMLVRKYPALDAPGQSAVFVWFLSVAPEAVLLEKRLLDEVPKRLGTALLDTALCVSFGRGHGGRTGLHAAPEGGDKLLGWYHEQGMTRLPPEAALPPRTARALRGNDGRYFFYDRSGALAASRRMDPWR